MDLNSQTVDAPVAVPLICVCCGTSLAGTLKCDNCSHAYAKNPFGYVEMLKEPWDHVSAPDDYVEAQEHTGLRVFQEYLLPLFSEGAARSVLDVGCGMGQGIRQMGVSGADAYGIDLPCYSRAWEKNGLDPAQFMCADACALPFPDNFFDVVYSLGVIEHIGTVLGHCTLRPDYWEKRQAYASEILRVTKDGGRIVIACPNKTFPVDVQHGPTDALSPKVPLRSLICEKTGLNFHKTWGEHHLLSYAETQQLFRAGRSFRALPLKGYFGFGKFERGWLKPFASLAKWYVDSMPEWLRRSAMNPYMLAQIVK
ncbi:MAG TPA: class I SAM-dependent methyltransferase [Terriglobales bacterium]|jgi:SAM-dependent methyltransferase|nr:class I SAM-dependent methyltransferase [Terriglobales bacterium]